jgi:hypothetical protein
VGQQGGDIKLANKEKANKEKGYSFRIANRRANMAMDNEYYLEAICLYESMIADRVLSYVSGVAPHLNASISTSFTGIVGYMGNCIRKVEMADEEAASGLVKDIKKWAKKRNSCVHLMAKSTPGTPTISVDEFIETAKETAAEGKKLFNSLNNWHKKEKRFAAKNSKI